ncbi:MAG: hypothetical protein II075_12580 [Bacteroidales bacterium]|nr:hypothetical protein [Bacteroidales bacterium]
MESIKTQFQNDLADLENTFMSFKDGGSQTFGAMWRAGLPFFLMLLSIFMAIDSFASRTSFTTCVAALAVLVFAILLFVRTAWLYDKNRVSLNELKTKIDSVEKKYAEYPDVEVLIKQLWESVSVVRRHERLITTLFWVSFVGFFIIYSVKIYFGFAEQSDSKLSNKVYIDHYCDALNLQNDVPMLRISPLKTDIANGITLKSEHIDVYLHYDLGNEIIVDRDTSRDYRALRMIAPDISGSDFVDKYRLAITDETGKRISGCPEFFFTAEDKGKIIKSDDFAFYDYSKQYQFQALHTLKYLQDNQQRLRFLVEKIN